MLIVNEGFYFAGRDRLVLTAPPSAHPGEDGHGGVGGWAGGGGATEHWAVVEVVRT